MIKFDTLKDIIQRFVHVNPSTCGKSADINFKDVAFDLEMERLKQEVEELRDIIKEAKTGFKKIKVPWYVTQFGDFILYLLIVSIISFIIIGPAYITLAFVYTILSIVSVVS